MLRQYLAFLSFFLAPMLLFAFEADNDFLHGPPPPKPPQEAVTEGTIEDVTGDGDTYYEEQTDDGDWYYGKAAKVRKHK